jgi:hypothetical protein
MNKICFHELFIAWRSFPVGEAIWEPFSVMAVDVPEMVAMFMESQDDTDMMRKIRSRQEFTRGSVMHC